MKTREELINDLRNSMKNYSEEQINEIADKYEASIKSRRIIITRKDHYNEVAKLIGVSSLNDVRFYKIMNASAIVVRDIENNKTKVAFSFYNIHDLVNHCKASDKSKPESGKILFRQNSIAILHQITIGNDLISCLHCAENYSSKKFFVEFNDIRISELAVYEAWIKLCKDKIIPRYYQGFNLDCHVVALNVIREREAANRSCDY